jgi:SOS-response transcriptional repressor LexA
MINEATGGYDYLRRVANMPPIDALENNRKDIQFNQIAGMTYNIADFQTILM